METFATDLRLSIRALWKSPAFTLIAVAALALGIGANTAIFTVVNTVLLRPLPYPDSERIVFVHRVYPNGSSDSSSLPKFFAWREATALDAMSAYDFAGPGLNLAGGDRPEQLKGIHVSKDYFRLFGAQPALGRTFLAEEDRPGGPKVAVLSNGLWKRRFGGDPGIAGRAIQLSGEQFVVTGILAPGFESDPPSDVFMPLQPDPASTNQAHYLRVSARLKPGYSIDQANAQLKVIAGRFRKQHPRTMDEKESAGVITLQKEMTGDVRPALLVLMGAVSFVLLIACANVANLLLARASGRQRELAIRSAIGASRWRIVRQLLTESLVLGALGGVLGLALGYAGVKVLLALTPGNVPRIGEAGTGVHLDGSVMLFTVGISLFTGILFGLFPALQASRPDLNTTLKEASGRSGTGMKQNKARGLLVISEMALAVVLLVGAALLIRTFSGLRNVDPGVETHNILTMQTSMTGERYATNALMANLERTLVQRIEAVPGVVGAAPAVTMPVQQMGLDLPIRIEGKAPPADGSPFHGDEYWRYVGWHYFDVFKIPLLRGRVFNENDTLASQPVVIVNDAFARKYWPGTDPIGRRMTIGGKSLGPEFDDPVRQVIGVVRNVHENSLSQPMAPVMYIPAAQVPDGLTRFANSAIPLTWVVRTNGDPSTLSQAIQKQFASVDSQLAVAKVQTMESIVSQSTARESFNTMLLTIFAGMALALAAIGIYGLMSYSVEQRTSEIGIRMALGAARSDMMKMVVNQGMLLALIGVAVGLAAAYGLTRFLDKMLFGVKPNDPATFVIVACVLSGVALVASCVPAFRATKIDPIIALRYE
jgi:predicted permease